MANNNQIINIMSKEVEEKELNPIEELNLEQIKQILNDSGYGEPLKKELAKFGAEKAWKPGRKKADVIKDGLEKIALIKQLLEDGKSKEEIDAALEEKEVKKIEKSKEGLIKEALEKEKAFKAKQTAEIKKDFSKDVLEKKIKNIDANLKQATIEQREMLVEKRKILQELLDKK